MTRFNTIHNISLTVTVAPPICSKTSMKKAVCNSSWPIRMNRNHRLLPTKQPQPTLLHYHSLMLLQSPASPPVSVHQSLHITQLQLAHWPSQLKKEVSQQRRTLKHQSSPTFQTLKACRSAMNSWSSHRILLRQSTRVQDWPSLRQWYSLSYHSIIIQTLRVLKVSQAASSK